MTIWTVMWSGEEINMDCVQLTEGRSYSILIGLSAVVGVA